MPPAGDTYTRGTPNMWPVAAADPKLGYVYLPLGNAAVDYYGVDRKDFENQFNSSIVAIDVTTGKPVWHFQTMQHDLWDYDLGSQPTLVDFPTVTGKTAAIIVPSKQGRIYVLDRKTGKPLFPVEERKVPSGGVEPDKLSKTPPYSGYAHLDQPVLTEKDMWGMSRWISFTAASSSIAPPIRASTRHPPSTGRSSNIPAIMGGRTGAASLSIPAAAC
ncbi:hypothetical protein RFM68_33095 [Mesorhizobium sp. MSK_1335]|uniref:Pyrrolo-quinoline quinone repeat domain-containing protein n=1 Tax=Mesorhizobium montanum TaxID=3072323 RepID=A0ABU4ZZB4_9HYPH|nr:hypothetical protein [Mesorhizobium sp. MSK_1335]MDX8529271.1 hypothetical protein [Mesorhizobium sp. MSK_1335]